ncbi:MAG: gfo/Idh/MocA family oxidoreductase, partial [Chthonomonadales bacterium]
VIKSGVLGQITEVHVVTDRSKGWWPQGMQLQPAAEQAPATLQWQQWLGPAADRTYSKDYLPFVWRGWWDFGTGALGDMACHLMDGPFQALNLKYPETVEAVSDVFSQFSPPVSAMITYQFGRRGDLGPVKLIWYDGGRRPPESVIEGRKLENGSIFVGEKGKLIVEHASSKPILFPEEKFATVTMKTYLAFDNKNHYFQFIDACIHGGPTDTTFNYACPLSETVLLGNVALRTGGKIEWDAARMRVKGRPDADVYIRKQYRPGYSL